MLVHTSKPSASCLPLFLSANVLAATAWAFNASIGHDGDISCGTTPIRYSSTGMILIIEKLPFFHAISISPRYLLPSMSKIALRPRFADLSNIRFPAMALPPMCSPPPLEIISSFPLSTLRSPIPELISLTTKAISAPMDTAFLPFKSPTRIVGSTGP